MMQSLKRSLNRHLNILTGIAIEPTNDCNMDCWFCHRKERKIGYMNFSSFKRIIDQIPIRVGLCLSYGGESILHPQFPDMVDYATKKGFKRIVVDSNGLKPYPLGVHVIVYPKPPPIIFTKDQKFQTPHNLKPVYSGCYSLHSYMAVLWNGDVVPCCHCVSGNRVVGNVFESSLSEVWHSREYRTLRELGHCPGCELYKYDLVI
jgi:MoaA/NifB/PqqE/SkfB family radical SAM enzyme